MHLLINGTQYYLKDGILYRVLPGAYWGIVDLSAVRDRKPKMKRPAVARPASKIKRRRTARLGCLGVPLN